MTPIATSECLQIQPSQFAADFDEISRIHFLNSTIFFYVTSHTITHEIIITLFTWGLIYVQSIKNRLTSKSFIANYNFRGVSTKLDRFPVFPGAISNFKIFPGFPGIPEVVDTSNLQFLLYCQQVCQDSWIPPNLASRPLETSKRITFLA